MLVITKKIKMHTIREKRLVELISEHVDKDITCAALLELTNQGLGPRFKISNPKQLGYYLRKIIASEQDLVYEKKVLFISPSTTIVRYVFKRIDLDEPDEIITQDLICNKDKEE